jgi:3-oxoacyl-[acyl-carrier-protein] synthase II
MRRVVVTGVGMNTPLGNSLDEVKARYLRGESAVRPMASSTPERPRVASYLDGDAAAGFPGSITKIADRSTLMSLAATDRLMRDAKLAPGEFDAKRIGTFVGMGLGASDTMFAGHESLFRKDHMSPMTVLKMLPNGPAANISMRYGLKGECATHSVACASAGAAIGHAYRSILHGYLDLAVAGGVEAPLGESSVRAWEAMRIMARIDPANPAAACRPFSKNRSGIVLGEGAVFYLLEDEARAKARGATIYARIAGYGLSADAGHITLPSQEGQMSSMQAALEEAGMAPSDIGYINAHGTATGQGDAIETRSVRAIFGSHADRTPMSSTKAFHGHLLGGSASIEMLAALIALRDGVLAPTLNLDEPDPECDLDYVANVARTGAPLQAVMNNNFAFGGSNATLILVH